jgi:copper resistance protein D
MHAWYLFTVWLHIIVAAVWVGSMAFLGLVVVPVLREADFQAVRTRLLYRTGLRYRWMSWVVLGLLVLTGILSVGFRGYGWSDAFSVTLWTGAWGHVLATKVALVVVVLVVSAWHDFHLGPRATDLLESDPTSDEARRVRKTASWIGRVMLLLSLAIVALGVMLVRGTP